MLKIYRIKKNNAKKITTYPGYSPDCTQIIPYFALFCNSKHFYARLKGGYRLLQHRLFYRLPVRD